MRIDWVNKKGNDKVIVFFNGWGMDKRVVSHLENKDDLLLCYDYRSLACDTLPDLSEYGRVCVVAWSMGVWAAAQVLKDWAVRPFSCIAINGTEHPVDDRFGIPLSVYALTEKGMNEKGREKFFLRMLPEKAERERFESNKPLRELPEQLEELYAIRIQSSEQKNHLQWDKVYISEKDVIFPPAHQLNWWQDRAVIKKLSGGHYPFYCFRNWEEIVEGRDELTNPDF